MRGFPRKQELSLKVAVEGNPEFEQVVDAGRALCDHHARHLLVDDTGTGRDGVCDMLLECIALAHRRGDPALRPGRGAP